MSFDVAGHLGAMVRAVEHCEHDGKPARKVVACEPPRHFRLTWEFAGATSWVSVVLAPAGQGTRLELEHLMPCDEQFWGKYGPGAVGVGWELALLGLRSGHNEGGEAWALGEEGRNFSRVVADGWREAAIAAGEDVAAATAAADNTFAFYTGQPH